MSSASMLSQWSRTKSSVFIESAFRGNEPSMAVRWPLTGADHGVREIAGPAATLSTRSPRHGTTNPRARREKR